MSASRTAHPQDDLDREFRFLEAGGIVGTALQLAGRVYIERHI
jgi:hypothetical protein